jgi:CheY-like chemotaxis protein
MAENQQIDEYILVIDDEEDIREALSALLGFESYAVVTAANGREALELLRHGHRPFFVLLDLMMPIMDGWQFLDAIAGDQELSSIPLSITTSIPERVPQGLHVIPKAINVDALFERVRWARSVAG